MAEIKWIKLATEIFDNRKIRMIESMPDGDGVIVIWIKLLCLAGNTNDCGMVYLTPEVPYTEQMLSSYFNRPITLIQMALRLFEQFGMIQIVDSIMQISNWEKYQNVEGMERIREQTRKRVARHKESRKLLQKKSEVTQSNVSGNVTVTQGNATDIEEDIEEDIDIDLDLKEKTISSADATDIADESAQVKTKLNYSEIISQYNRLCVTLPKVKSITDSRRQAMRNIYPIIEKAGGFEKFFYIVNESDFLSGRNSQWSGCGFDWIMKRSNAIKILEGNYENRGNKPKTSDGLAEVLGLS